MKRKNINVTNDDWLRIIRSYIYGNTISSISEIMGIKRTTVHQIIKKYQKTNHVEAQRRGAIKKQKINK